MEYNKEIGRWVYDERQNGRTFQSIADELGTSVSTPYKWVNKYIDSLEQEGSCSSNCSCTISDNDYDLLNGEEISIYPVSDWHIGSPQCNYDFINYWSDLVKEDNNEILLFGIGDYLEIASKSVGNSSFKQEMSVNEQMETFIKYIKPFKKHLSGIVSGNHSNNRLSKDYDFDIDMEIAARLGTNCYSRKMDNFLINGVNYSVYYRHGNGSVSKAPLAGSKIMRDNNNVDADLILNGHVHRSTYIDRVIDLGEYNFKRQHYVYCGSMLDFAGSYGDVNGLPPLLPSFPVIKLKYNFVNDKIISHVEFVNSDEVL